MDSEEWNDDSGVGRKPKRREVGRCGDTVIYQLSESTSCLDCFRKIPVGALICMSKVVSDRPIPRCLMNSGLSMEDLVLSEELAECSSLSCPGCLTPDTVQRYVSSLEACAAREPLSFE